MKDPYDCPGILVRLQPILVQYPTLLRFPDLRIAIRGRSDILAIHHLPSSEVTMKRLISLGCLSVLIMNGCATSAPYHKMKRGSGYSDARVSGK